MDDVLFGKILVRHVVMADGQVAFLYGLSPLCDFEISRATLDEIEAKIAEFESDREWRDKYRRERASRKTRASDELYQVARMSRDIEAVASGNPIRIARRIKNRIIGHVLARALRRLWR